MKLDDLQEINNKIFYVKKVLEDLYDTKGCLESLIRGKERINEKKRKKRRNKNPRSLGSNISGIRKIGGA